MVPRRQLGTYTYVYRGRDMADLPIFMLHGLAGSPENWVEMMDRLPASVAAFAPDIPFFAEKGHLDSVAACTDYAVGFIEAVAPNGAILVGNSLGGHVAIDVASLRPELVKGLVLTGSSGLFERDITTSHGVHPARDKVERMVADIFFDPRHVTEAMVDEAYDLVSSRKMLKRLVRLAISAKRDNVTARLKAMHCPVLLVWGRDDIITPPEVGERFDSLIPHSDIMWLRDCGHAPMMEHPADFAYAVEEWLGKRIGLTVPQVAAV